MTWFDFFVLALATWRLASLLSREDGPFYLFARARHWAGVRYNEQSQMISTNHLAEGVLCLWCNSVWFAILWTGLYFALNELAVWLALPFALSTAAIMLEELCTPKRQ